MTKKEIELVFKNYLSAQKAYQLEKERVARIRADAEQLKALNMSGMPHGTDVSNPVLNAICKIIAAAELVNKAAAHYYEQLLEYEQLLSLVSNTDAVVIIREHYENGVPFEKLPCKLPLSERTIYRYYESAIQEIIGKT